MLDVLADATKINPFSDRRIREATNWLYDRDYINQEIYGGAAIPKWFSLVSGFPDYARMIDVIRPLEVQYSFDRERAVAVIDEEMAAFGAEKVDGKWLLSFPKAEKGTSKDIER